MAQVIVSTNCKSAGEALREIDVKDMIKSDFVLVSGDVVSNMDLCAAMRAHRARRDKDKNAIMTLVHMCSPFSRIFSGRQGC
jgi:translation initiation factor eIF-2B subunit epsilon